MNVTSVKCNYDDKFLDLILGMNALNDIVLDRNFIEVEVNDIDPLNFIYRRFYENTFLRRSGNNVSEYLGNNRYNIKISIGEGISILKQLLPPVFQIKAHELYSSINVLVDTLQYYLTDIDTGTLDLQVRTFCKAIAWNPFETNTTYDKSRMKTLREHAIPKGENGSCIDLYAYKGDLKEIYKGNVNPGDASELQCVFSYGSKKCIFDLIDVLKENKNIMITNVFAPEGVSFSCIEIYVNNFVSVENEALTELIKNTYSHFNMGL
jgi:hypothetical protein